MDYKRKNGMTTMYAWTSADGNWTKDCETEKNMNDFLSQISKLHNVAISEKKHSTRTWKNKKAINYVYVTITYSNHMNDTIWLASRSSSVSLSFQSPVD